MALDELKDRFSFTVSLLIYFCTEFTFGIKPYVNTSLYFSPMDLPNNPSTSRPTHSAMPQNSSSAFSIQNEVSNEDLVDSQIDKLLGDPLDEFNNLFNSNVPRISNAPIKKKRVNRQYVMCYLG